uniref:Uncharacterized protein n=1 Tax=Magallana gigas TaxID=29159 RepID=K1R425_MAGGI
MATPFFSNFCFQSKIERTLVLGHEKGMHAYAGHGNTSRSYSGFDQHDLLRLIKRELINASRYWRRNGKSGYSLI